MNSNEIMDIILDQKYELLPKGTNMTVVEKIVNVHKEMTELITKIDMCKNELILCENAIRRLSNFNDGLLFSIEAKPSTIIEEKPSIVEVGYENEGMDELRSDFYTTGSSIKGGTR